MASTFANYASVMKELPQVQRLDAMGKRLWRARPQALRNEVTRRRWFHQWNRFATMNNRFRMESQVCAKHLADNMPRIFPDLKP
ncbi:MAG: hypothetical protein H6827_09710 [Planctomycetes bacterium]|nr:hypothetical protein [Planctomycetota bacterium]